MIAFAVVVSAIVDMFKGAMAETQHDPAVHSLMERFLWLTLLVWALFPMVWMAARLGYISLSTEQVRGGGGSAWGWVDFLS
jgi:bacteriorhodopsin